MIDMYKKMKDEDQLQLQALYDTTCILPYTHTYIAVATAGLRKNLELRIAVNPMRGAPQWVWVFLSR